MEIYNTVKKILLLILIVILALVTVCNIFDIGFYNVSSAANEPDIKPNSLVITKKNRAAKIGDSIVFESDSGISVCKVVGETDTIYITKDLTKEAADSWQVDKSRAKGKVLFSVPVIGIIFYALTSKVGKILLGLLAIAFFASFLVAKTAPAGTDNSEYKEKYNNLARRYLNVLTLFAEKKMINNDFLEKEKEKYIES